MTRVLIVGAGGLGSRIAVALMAGGIGAVIVEPGGHRRQPTEAIAAAYVRDALQKAWPADKRYRTRVAEWKRNPLDRYRR